MAEVASQVNEIILARYLIDHTDDKLEKLNILDSLMELHIHIRLILFYLKLGYNFLHSSLMFEHLFFQKFAYK